MSTKLTRTVPLTDLEIRSVEAIIQTGSYSEAAKLIHVKVVNLRKTTMRIRSRYDAARLFVEDVERYQRQLPRKKRYLTG